MISKQFGIHRSTVARYIVSMRTRDVVPLHYGFVDQHFVKCDDGQNRPFTKDLVFGELSTWMSLEIAEKLWNGENILDVGDGTYIYCENFDGFFGNTELFSGHKMRTFAKSMCISSSRGYWVKVFAGYGGSVLGQGFCRLWWLRAV